VKLRMAAILAVLALVPGTARAQSVATGAIYPLVPLRPGATLAQFGISSPSSDPLRVDVQATSASDGLVAQITGLVVARDSSSETPFHFSVPFREGLPEDAQIQVSARSVASAAATVRETFALDSDPTVFARATDGSDISISAAADGSINVSFAYSGPIAQADLYVVGASSSGLRAVNGNLQQTDAIAFASARLTLRPQGADRRISASIPVRPGSVLPADGVVVVDAALTDASGRVVHASAVQATGGAQFDQLLSVAAAPTPILLTVPYQRTPLSVTANFVDRKSVV